VKRSYSLGAWGPPLLVMLIFASTLVLAQTGPQRRVAPQIFGTHGNAWSAATVGIAGTSNVTDTAYTPICSAFGNSASASTITVQLSADGSTFYSSAFNTGVVTGNFNVTFSTGARYVRLISSAASVITATVQCKG
jgi:hypothetical protein